MKNKKIIKRIAKYLDVLGYRKNKITWYFDKNKWTNEKFKMYKVSISLVGAQKYFLDLEESKKKYGVVAGLWTKNEAVKKLLNKKPISIGKDRNKYLALLLMKITKNIHVTRNSDIMNMFDLKSNETESLLRFMCNKNNGFRINKGIYWIVGEQNEIS